MAILNVSSYQESINLIGAEYSSPVRQARIKNYLFGLRLSSYTSKGTEVSEALVIISKLILKPIEIVSNFVPW